MGTPKSQPNTDPRKPLDNLHAETFCLTLMKVEFADAAIQGGIIAKLGKSNKLGAIALLARLEGWEKPQKVEHSGVVEVVRHDDGRG